jgi:hypothetical protein
VTSSTDAKPGEHPWRFLFNLLPFVELDITMDIKQYIIGMGGSGDG